MTKLMLMFNIFKLPEDHNIMGFLSFCIKLSHFISDYMDGPSTCGQTIIIYDNIINLAARSPISTPNPPRVCTTYLRSGYTDSYYYIKVEWTATIKDCAFSLTIYNGSTPSGAPIVCSCLFC